MAMRLLWLIAALLLAMLAVEATADAGQARWRQALEDRRVGVLVRGLRARLDLEIALGLPLARSPRAQAWLEDERARAPQLLALEIVSTRGESLFNTDRGLLDQDIPAGWLDAMHRHPDGWHSDGAGDRSLGLALRGPDGDVAGYLVPTYRRDDPASLSGTLAHGLRLAALLTVLAITGVVQWRHERRWRARRAAALAAFESAAAPILVSQETPLERQAPVDSHPTCPMVRAGLQVAEAHRALAGAASRARDIAEGVA